MVLQAHSSACTVLFVISVSLNVVGSCGWLRFAAERASQLSFFIVRAFRSSLVQDHREQCHDVHHIPPGELCSLIVAPALFVLVWSAKEWFVVGRNKILLSLDQKDKNDAPLLIKSEQLQNMNGISSISAAGAKSFLKAEYLHMTAYIVLFFGVLFVATEWKTSFFGCVTSMLCGWFGMMISVTTNFKTAHQCWTSEEGRGLGFNIAIQGGSVVGLSLVSLGVLALFVLIELSKLMLTAEKFDGDLGYLANKYQLPSENTDGR